MAEQLSTKDALEWARPRGPRMSHIYGKPGVHNHVELAAQAVRRPTET